MTTTDHAAEAERLIALASAQRDESTMQVFATGAQVRATLALAEQQRIANLIALAQLSPDDSIVGELRAVLNSEATYALAEWVPISGVPDDEAPSIRPEIARALGIEVPDGR